MRDVRAGRLRGGVPRHYVPLAPDLAVETVSPDDRPSDVERKVAEWLRSGVRMVWVIEPAERTVTVQRAGREPRCRRETDFIDGEDVLPGFRLPVAALWPGGA